MSNRKPKWQKKLETRRMDNQIPEQVRQAVMRVKASAMANDILLSAIEEVGEAPADMILKVNDRIEKNHGKVIEVLEDLVDMEGNRSNWHLFLPGEMSGISITQEDIPYRLTHKVHVVPTRVWVREFSADCVMGGSMYCLLYPNGVV